MPYRSRTTDPTIDGVQLFEPEQLGATEDQKLLEAFREDWLRQSSHAVRQMTRSDKPAGMVIGLHYHLRQSDYWYVVSGSCRAGLVDVRAGSPTFGNAAVVELGDHGAAPDFIEDRALHIPPGVAHGYYAITPVTIIFLFDQFYSPDDVYPLRWDDAELQVPWGLTAPPRISARDDAAPLFSDIALDQLPTYPSDPTPTVPIPPPGPVPLNEGP